MLAGIEVHDDGVEAAHLVEQRVTHALGDIVPFGHGQLAVHDQVGAGDEAVPHPAHTHGLDLDDALDAGGRTLDVVDQLRIDRVHQAPEDGASSVAQDPQDGDGDDQADERVGQREAEPHADGRDDHGDRGEPVGACVQPVGDERL